MKLGEHVEMVLGTCISNDDPKKLGRIKVAAPGYFDSTVMAIEAIPWAYPLTMSGYQAYSTITEGGKVWLIDNKENADEYWYIPFHELNTDTSAAVADDIQSDVLLSRNNGGQLTQVYQNNTEGIVIRNGNAVVKVTSDGAVTIETDTAAVRVEGGTVYCGSKDGKKEPMVRGSILQDILDKLAGNMRQLWTASQQNPYTTQLAPGFQNASEDINSMLTELNSSSCTLSK